MPKKTHHVKLNKEEYLRLHHYVREGTKSARSMNRARILLLADEQKSDEEIAETLGINMATVYRVRKRYHEMGLSEALAENPAVALRQK